MRETVFETLLIDSGLGPDERLGMSRRDRPPLPAAMDRRQGTAPSWIGVLRDANVSLFRGGAGTAHGAAIYGILQSAYPPAEQFAVNVIGRVAFDPKSTQSGKLYPQGSNRLTGIRTPVRASSVPSSRERRSAALQGITTIKSVSFPISVLNS